MPRCCEGSRLLRVGPGIFDQHGKSKETNVYTFRRPTSVTGTTALVQLLETSRLALTRSVSDFSGEQWSCVPTEGLACAAWIVGHAALVDRQVLEELEELGELKISPLPRLPEDWDSQFQSRQEEQYITTLDNGNSVLTQFVKHRHALIAAVSQLAPDILDFPLDPPSQHEI